jgi:integrase
MRRHLIPPAGPDGDLIVRYAQHQAVRGFTTRTIDRRTWTLCRWLTHLEGTGVGLLLADATAVDVESFLAAIPSPQSRYSMRSDIAMFYRWALRRGLLETDPTVDVDPPRIPRRLPTPVNAADVKHLLEVLDGQDRLLVMLGALAGLRVSEIANLRGEDIDLEHRRITIRNGKGGGDATVPLARQLADELAQWPRTGTVLVLASGQTVAHRIRLAFRRHGIAGRPHDLRAAFATAAADASGGNVMLVAKLMRHADIATTMRYVQVDRAGTDIVDQLFT